MLKFYTPVDLNVILFENRVFCICNHVKMKSFWGTVGPNSVHLCPYEERRGDTYKVYKEGECHVTDNKGRDWIYVATSQEIPRIASY